MKREPESEARKGAFHKFEPNFMTGTGLRVRASSSFPALSYAATLAGLSLRLRSSFRAESTAS